MTELAENPQDSFDPCLDAPVFGAVNLGGDTDSPRRGLPQWPYSPAAVRYACPGTTGLVAQMTELERLSVALVNAALI